MTGQPCLALWKPATDTYPTAPTFARALNDLADSWQNTLRNTCAHLTYPYT